MKDYKRMTVGEIVADNFNNAGIFAKYGIDFCCHGSALLPEASKTAGADMEKVIEEIEIEELLDKICRVHGEKHPSLYNVQALFHDSLSDLNAHLDKEELVLFPYIYEMVKAKLENTPLPEFHCGSIEAPISVMMAEHDIEGERYRHIEHLTNGYTAPEDACNSYRLVLQQLKAFEEALHQHIHLENNIVFPRSIKMEAKLREQP